MKILNKFPGPRPLTEQSLLSRWELYFYVGLTIVLGLLYYAYNRIPVKDIYIEAAKVDNTEADILRFYNEHEEDSLYTTACNVDIHIPYTDFFSNSHGHYHYQYCIERIPNYFNEYSENKGISRDDIKYYTTDNRYYLKEDLFYNKNYIDSLSDIFYAVNNDGSNYHPIYYHSAIFISKDIRFYKTYDISFNDTLEKSKPYYPTEIYKKRIPIISHEVGIKSFTPGYGHEQINGILSNPIIIDFHDISQCYYRIHLKSQFVNAINLRINFLGAVEMTYIKEKPKSIDAQSICYKFHESNPFYGIEKEVILYVKSKEFAGKQSSRLFFLTSFLSALITILLAFSVVYFYRKCIYSSKKQNTKEEDKKVEETKTEELIEDKTKDDIVSNITSNQKHKTKKQKKSK